MVDSAVTVDIVKTDNTKQRIFEGKVSNYKNIEATAAPVIGAGAGAPEPKKLPITKATASGFEPNSTNTPDKAHDGLLETRWSVEGADSWIQLDHELANIDHINVAHHNGDSRTVTFEAYEQDEQGKFYPVGSFTTSKSLVPASENLKLQTFKPSSKIKGKALKLIMKSVSDNRGWYSLTEVEVWGVPAPATTTPTPTPEPTQPQPQPQPTVPGPQARKYPNTQAFVDSLKTVPLKPGDVIELAEGRHNLAASLTLTASGTKESPIRIRAAKNQKTILTGRPIHRKGAHIYFEGVDIQWDANEECRVDGADCADIQVNYSLKNMPGVACDWVNYNGPRFVFDRVSYQNKTEQGAMFVMNGAGARGKQMYFYKCGTKKTPNEAFRVGSSSVATKDLDCEFTDILFEEIGGPGGEDECATIKAENVRIIRPTLLNCDAALTIRHGKRNRLEDVTSINSGGARVYGENAIDGMQIVDDAGNHQLVHGLTLGSGDVVSNPVGADTKYEQVQNGIYRKIIIVQKVATTDTLISLGDTKRPLHPKNNKLQQIIVWADFGTMAKKFGAAKWEDNQVSDVILFGKAAKGDMPATMYRAVDPKLKLRPDGTYEFTDDSPIKWVQTTKRLSREDVGPLA